MESNQWLLVEELLNEALLLSPSDRTSFLDAITDRGVRNEVESLLKADGDGLELTSVIGEAAKSFCESAGNGTQTDDTAVSGEYISDRYRLVRVIGEGGMGTVYLAEQSRPVRRNVALKIIRRGMDSSQVIARFEAERQTLAMMDHPNIARVLDAGATSSGHPYFVMELVDGVPITQYCDSHGLTVRERLALFASVCNAVQHAHQKGVIHRDIKPSNILVTQYDGRAVPKVIDFGLAKAVEQPLISDGLLATVVGTVVGTPQYMSPEQALSGGSDIDTRSDIYSLGTVLYELLTGSPPLAPAQLANAAHFEILRRIQEEDTPIPSVRVVAQREALVTISALRSTDASGLRRMLRGDLDWVVMKALDKDRTQRYSSASDLATDLERYLANDPVEAGPPSALYRARKFAFKHRFVILIGCGFVGMLIIAAGLSIWQANRRNHERDRAFAALHIAEAQRLVGEVKENFGIDPELSLLLALHAIYATVRFSEPAIPAAEGALHTALLSSQVRTTLSGHKSEVRAIAYSPDGKRIATGGDDGQIRVWDSETGKELLSFGGHTAWIWGIAFSADGHRLATANPDSTATLWDASTGQEVLRLRGHAQQVTAIGFSPNGKRVVTGSGDNTVRFWDAETGRETLMLRGHQDGIWGVRFSPDGKRVATASADKNIQIWDSRDGRKLLKLVGHEDKVKSVDFNRDGTLLVSSGADKTARVWNATTGRQLLTVTDSDGPLWSATFTAEGDQIVTAGRIPKLWDTSDGRQRFELRGHRGQVFALALSPDGNRLATASQDSTARVWAITESTELLTLRVASDYRTRLVLNKDGTKLATFRTDDGVITIRECCTGRKLLTLNAGINSISSVAFNLDGSLFAAGYNGGVKVWELPSGRELGVMHTQSRNIGVLFTRDGQRMAVADADSVTIVDTRTLAELVKVQTHNKPIVDVSFSPDNRLLATASSDETARIWDLSNGMELRRLTGHAGPVRFVAFGPDGTQIVTTDSEWDVRVWHSESGSLLTTLRGGGSTAYILPGGKRVITTFLTNNIWDLDNQQKLFRLGSQESLRSDRISTEGVAISPDGRRLIVAQGGAIQVYALELDDLLALAKTRVTRTLTTAECRTYFQTEACPTLP